MNKLSDEQVRARLAEFKRAVESGDAYMDVSHLSPDPVNHPVHYPKQPRYQDESGDDWIDEFARTATREEFRGAMRFTIGKYNRRAGKKDELIAEIRKMHDYCGRWLAYEEAK